MNNDSVIFLENLQNFNLMSGAEFKYAACFSVKFIVNYLGMFMKLRVMVNFWAQFEVVL